MNKNSGIQRTSKRSIRSVNQKEADLEMVSRLMVYNLSVRQIAEQIGVSHPQIVRDQKIIRQRWAESAKKNYEEVVSESIERITELERQAWAAWQRSRQHGEAGDERFLGRLESLIERRWRITGLTDKMKNNAGEEDYLATRQAAARILDNPLLAEQIDRLVAQN